MSADEKKVDGLRDAAAEAVEAATNDGALVPAGVSAEEARVQLAVQTADTERALLEVQEYTERMEMELRQEVEEQKAVMQRRVDEARNEMAVKMREMREMMEPLKKQMARLEEGIWTVELYLGSKEQIVTLREGRPASAGTHVRVRQLVLAMDQEAAVAAEGGGLDSLDIYKFDDWLKESWAHVEQVLPEEKGIVALVPRWDEKTHWSGVWEEQKSAFGTVMKEMKRKADVYATQAAAEGNAVTYFLIRNGENLYRIAMGEFNAGATLMPSRGEWESFFETGERRSETGIKKTLVPGTDEWEKAEEEADYRKRHYMRVGLILQGLADRTQVLDPVPGGHEEGAASVLNFLQESEYVDMVMDGDLTLGTGRKPYEDWLKDVNREMRPGERVVLAVESEGFESHKYKVQGSYDKYGHHRLYPLTIEERPVTGELYTIKGRRGRGLTIQFDRVSKTDNREYYRERRRWLDAGSDPVTRPSPYIEKEVKATCTIYPEDSWVIAFDRVSEEEVRSYLESRLERHAYVEMFPVLKAVLRAKQEERESEAPFRAALSGAMARESSAERAEEEVDELIQWYKFEHRNHRALEEDDEKAVRFILAEFGRRLRGEEAPMDETLLALLEDEHPDYLLIGRRRDGRYAVLTPVEEEPEGPFVHEWYYLASGKLSEKKEWTLINHRADRWRVALEGERWASWDREAFGQEYISLPDRRGLVGAVRYAWGERLLGARFDKEEREFVFWLKDDDLKLPAENRRITESVTEPSVDTFVAPWRRTPGGVVLENHGLMAGGGTKRKGPWGGRNYSRRRGVAPWTLQPFTYYNPSDKSETARFRAKRAYDAKQARVEAELLYVNEELLGRLYEEERDAEVAKVEQKRLRAIAQRFEAQIKERWVADRIEEVRAAFWEKHGAAAAAHLWPTYRRNKVEEPSWSYDKSRHTSYWDDGPRRDLGGALERVVEEGIDPAGHTVREVADLARYFSWVAWGFEDNPDWKTRRKLEDQWRWKVPEEVAPMVFEALGGPAPTGEECGVCGEVHGGDDEEDYHSEEELEAAAEAEVEEEDTFDPETEESEGSDGAEEVDGEIADEEERDDE